MPLGRFVSGSVPKFSELRTRRARVPALTLFVKIVYLVGDLSAGNECRAAAMGKMAPWFAGFGLAILSQTLVSWAFGFTGLVFAGLVFAEFDFGRLGPVVERLPPLHRRF